MKRCKTALGKTSSLTDKQKQKWMPCIRYELISSEDSETETDEEGGKSFKFTVRPILWQSDKVSSFWMQSLLSTKARKVH